MRYVLVTLLIGAMVVLGCTATQKGAGIGGVLGAGAGYAIGKQSGHGAEGAGIGAAVGAIGGALIGKQMETEKYCPTCGRHFSSSTEYCPYDGAALEVVQ